MIKQLHPSDLPTAGSLNRTAISTQSSISSPFSERGGTRWGYEVLNYKYQLNLASKKVLINDILFQVDGYSACPPAFLTKAANPPILCEIYSRIGKMKVAQYNKIGKDILKMLLIEKMFNKTFRKIIAFADEEAAKCFSGGESWYSKLCFIPLGKDNFNIEILVIEIPSELKESLINAQKRQYR